MKGFKSLSNKREFSIHSRWEKRYTNDNTSGAEERTSDVKPVVLGDLNDGADEHLRDLRNDRP